MILCMLVPFVKSKIVTNNTKNDVMLRMGEKGDKRKYVDMGMREKGVELLY